MRKPNTGFMIDGVADRLRQLRESAGLTKKQLSNLLRVDPSAVSKWEYAVAAPTAVYIVRLSNIYKVSTDYILKGEAK